MRPTDFLCLACEFRVAMNEQSDMTTGSKLQYLQKIASSHSSFGVFVVQLLFARAQVLET